LYALPVPFGERFGFLGDGVSFFPHQQQNTEPSGVSFLHFGQFIVVSLKPNFY
jgi:hypothetical protein